LGTEAVGGFLVQKEVPFRDHLPVPLGKDVLEIGSFHTVRKTASVLDKSPLTIRRMFGQIAPRYDRANRLLSMNLDRQWRRHLAKNLLDNRGRVLDIASGTGDLAVDLQKQARHEVVSLDFTFEMLAWGRKKLAGKAIPQICGDALSLPCRDSTFDAACVAFGVRNFAEPEIGLREMVRVVKQGGTIGILEFSRPKGPFSGFYQFYFRRILPAIGGAITGSRAPYEYLPASVGEFPEGNDFLQLLEAAGLERLSARRLSGGIVTFYRGTKP